ncbi:MAG: LysM peptidoglycan-binding domain-containing protein [Tepidisphaeraceae bacterium]
MMRKDVKLGLAIGGVLLAVIVVYVMVAPSDNQKGAALVTEEPVVKPASPADGSSPPTGSEVALGNSTATPTTQPSASAAAPDSAGALSAGNEGIWELALSKGVMKTQTPPVNSPATPSEIDGGASAQRNPAPQAPPAATNVPVERGSSDPSLLASYGTPSTAPSTVRTHVVQRGETLGKIAQVAYGNASFARYIVNANPGIDPNRLRPGTTINLPPVSDVRPQASGSSSGSTNSRTEYRVEAGDSLYRISMKLYGRADMVDKIYDLNKETIGPDRAKLKLNMVLKLPEPAAASASAR